MGCTHVLVTGSRVSTGTLAQAAAYTTFDKHDLIDVGATRIYARMFQHRVLHETWQSVIKRGIETITFDTFVAEIFENVQ